MKECPVCDGKGGWCIPGTRDWGTCSQCKGEGELNSQQHEAYMAATAYERRRVRDLQARARSGRVPPAPS